MNQSLSRGGNLGIGAFSGTVVVTHDIDPKFDINLSAFLLTDAGKVQGDNGIVYYNQPEYPGGACVFIAPENSGNSKQHKINFDLNKVPTGITKIAITLTEDNRNGFASVKNLQAAVHAGGEIINLVPDTFSNENGIIVLELYLRNQQAKVKAVWQGFSSGLDGLCNHYGVEVDEAPAIPLAPPADSMVETPPIRPVINLTKPTESHQVSLQKGINAPKKILVSATWVDNGDGYDGNDDLDLRIGILLPDGQMKIIQAPDKSGSFNTPPYVFHTGDVTKASVDAPGIETVEVNPEISILMGGRVALVCSVYSAVQNGVVSVASLKPKMRMEYGNEVVECSFEFKNSLTYTPLI